MRPILLKLGGSVVTDKERGGFRRSVTRRLCAEAKKAQAPVVLFHGAGSNGHPEALQHGIGSKPATPAGVAAVMASVGLLHAEVVRAADEAGLNPISVPLHTLVTSEAGMLQDIPFDAIEDLLRDGFTPIISGCLVRCDELEWRIVSADEWMAEFAAEMTARVAVFCTDVDGVLDQYPDGEPLPVVRPADLEMVSEGEDATGGMAGKLRRALQAAETTPVMIVNGNVRGRLQQALQGRDVVCTRIATA